MSRDGLSHDTLSLTSSKQSEIISFTSANDGQIHPIDSQTSLEKIQSISSSFSTVSKRITSTARSLASNVKDDNLQTAKSLQNLQKTDLGRILTHLELEDAIRVATNIEGNSLHNGKDLDEINDNKELSKLQENLQLNDYDNYPPPDKGYAWVICFAELLLNIATWGTLTSFGIYISYWLNNDYFEGGSATDYALTSSICVFLSQSLAPIASITSNTIGMKPTMAFGIALYFSGFLLTSFVTELWQLYCTQGLMMGFGFAFIFHPSIVLLSYWFVKKRALSSGIVVCGSGIGGVVFVLSAQKLINDEHDFRWAMRMVSIISVVLNISATFLLKERIPKKRERSWRSFKQQCRIIFNPKVLKRWPIILISFWFGFGITAYMVLTYSLAAYSTFLGLSQTTGAHVTAIFNGCQTIGRPFIGVGGDRFGKINLALCLNIFVIILIFAFWVNCDSFITVLFFAIVSGLTTGWCQLLNQAILPDSVPIQLFPSAWGYESILVGCFCLFSDVVALKLRDMTASNPFLKAQIFSGCMTIVSFFCLVPVREYKVRKTLKCRLEQTKTTLESIFNSTTEATDIGEGLGNEKIDIQCNSTDDISVGMLQARKDRYEHLLRPGVAGYLERLIYPMIA